MYCPRCGESNPDSDRFCSDCGQDLATYRRLWTVAAPPAPTTQPLAAAPVATAVPLHAGAPVTLSSAESLPVAPPAAPRVPDYLGWAAALLALCWPAFWAAIPALVFASRAESQLARGDIGGAWASASRAKTWCWVTFCAGCVLWVVILLLVVTLLT
jgi:hypothetical protein